MNVRTQDLIFTLYGDYFLEKGGTAWIGSVIQLLGALDVSEQAVRSAASRMARKGWLETHRDGRKSYYSLTRRAVTLLTEGAEQIFQPPPDEWDGCWYLLTYAFSDDLSSVRHKLRQRLTWLGFGQLAPGTMISPRNLREKVRAILDELDAHDYAHYFRADHVGFSGHDSRFVYACWDLNDLRRRYERFLDKYQPQFERDSRDLEKGNGRSAVYYFRQRFWLIHDYRFFPFHDPYLPSELLPDSWPGQTAVRLFKNYHALLGDEAGAYVDDVLAQAP